MNKLVNDGVYLHINNGGVSFGVTNEDYLAIEIEAGHCGNVTNRMKLYITQDALRKIGQAFLDASEIPDLKVADYLSLDYFGLDKDTGKTKWYVCQQPSSDIVQNHNIGATAAAVAGNNSEYVGQFMEKINEIPKLFS